MIASVDGFAMSVKIGLAILACAALAGCVSAPTGPSVMVLPGSGRSFDDFRMDEGVCRRYALEQNGGVTAQQSSQESAVSSAAVGTVVGAVAGAAIGGQQGAGVGAGTGLIVGSMAGVNASQQAGWGTQRQYDNAYIQCMYAKGHRVPVPPNMAAHNMAPAPTSAPSRAVAGVPPPPPGRPPAPPPN